MIELQQKIENKNILLLIPQFFGYEISIKDKLVQMGASVTCYDDDPSAMMSTIIETLWHFNVSDKVLLDAFQNRLYRKICHSRYDVVIVINGWALKYDFINKLKNNLLAENGRMILYYWDSISVLKDDVKRRCLFDKIFTFDNIDYNNNTDTMKFLPLFYCDEYDVNANGNEVKYDLLTIGSYKYNRYFEIQRLKNNNPNIKIKAILYAKKTIIIHKLLRRKYKNVDISTMIYRPLSRRDIINLYKHSKAVLDIPFKGQNGLTMRTFECIGMRKKIVTSNQNILKYDFYRPENVFLIDTEEFKLPSKEWFDTDTVIPDEIRRKYSLDSWLSILLSDE